MLQIRTFFRPPGELSSALALLEESLVLFRRVSFKRGIALVLVTKGLVALVKGEYATASSPLEEGLALARTGRWRHGIVWSVYGLGWLAFLRHDYETAHSLFEEGLVLCRELGNEMFTPFYLEGLASTAIVQGLLVWAAQLWGASDMLRRTIELEAPPVLHSIYKRLKTNLQAQLGEESFTALLTQGRTMTLDQVLSYRETTPT